MKLLYFAQSIIPSRAANSIHVMKMCQAFSKAGLDVCLVTRNRHWEVEPNVKDIFEYYGISTRFKLLFSYFSRFKGKTIFNFLSTIYLLLKTNPDYVYGRSLFACSFSAMLGYKTIIEFHAPIEINTRETKFFFNSILRSKNLIKIVVISEALKQIFIKRYKLDHRLVYVAHDGADIESGVDYQGDWPGRKNAFQIGYSGHLYPGRGVELIASLADSCIEFDFHIAGGTNEDIAYWLTEYNLPNLHFHGFISPSKIAAWRSMVDVLLAPYRGPVAVYGGGSDTSEYMSPLKVFEYMAANKAILVSDFPVIREVLNEKNAMLLDQYDTDVWRIALLQMDQNSSKRIAIARQAYIDLCKYYSWEVRAQNLVSLFKMKI